jgi:acyl-CoA synthetase (AMP-forming)/AMP-acid ligase II
LVQLVQYRAETEPNEPAFIYLTNGVDNEIVMSNADLDRQARRIAAWLQSRNMFGQRILLLYPPGLEFITAYFGCLYAGAIAVPVYPPRRNRSIQRIQSVADSANAAVALTTEDVIKSVSDMLDEAPSLKKIDWLATSTLDDNLADQWTLPDINPETIAFLQYTSGSTGTPKGVILTHGNLLHNSYMIHQGFEHTRVGCGCFWLPSYHDMGLIGGILQPLYCGRPNIIMSPLSFLQKPFRWLAAITRYKATTSGGPNFAYDL